MHDFSYSTPAEGHAAPIAARDDRAGLLVIADLFDAEDFAPVAHGAGLRLLGVVDHASAIARLDAQAMCDVVLLCCPTPGPMLERLLVQVETQAIQNGMSIIVVTGPDTLDLAFACQRGQHSELLCDPDLPDLAAALVTAADRRPPTGLVHEGDRETLRLQQLSEEVGRLARTIDALTQRARTTPALPTFDGGARIADRSATYAGAPMLAAIGTIRDQGNAPPINAAQVRDLLRARRMRADFLPGDLFADPAWDMLLDLLAAHLDQERVSVSSLCIAAAVPPTTALRWIRTLTDRGLVERQADPLDGRRVFIALAHETAESLIRWFTASRRIIAP